MITSVIASFYSGDVHRLASEYSKKFVRRTRCLKDSTWDILVGWDKVLKRGDDYLVVFEEVTVNTDRGNRRTVVISVTGKEKGAAEMILNDIKRRIEGEWKQVDLRREIVEKGYGRLYGLIEDSREEKNYLRDLEF